MIVQLILQGRYKDGDLFTHGNARRIVPVALDIKHERNDVQRFFCKDENRDVWGLKDDDTWWRIVEAFEIMEPTEKLHANKYPVAYAVTEKEFEEILEENNGKNSTC